MARIVAFGNPVYDDITTPVLSTHGRVLSGCSTNVCLALAHLGHQTALVGSVGPDLYERFSADMARFGIEPFVRLGEQTGGFRLVYDQRGDRTLDVLGVAGAVGWVPPVVTDAAAIVIGPILQETSLELIEAVRGHTRAPLFLDPQGLLRRIEVGGRIEHYLPTDFHQIARRCFVIKANELETRVITGIDPRIDPTGAARQLRASGCQVAIVTLAEAGSVIDDGFQQLRIPAYATEARDPTGAGDTYLAGFIHSYLEAPQDLYRAGCMGAAVASIWIESTGPETPIAQDVVLARLETLLREQPPASFT